METKDYYLIESQPEPAAEKPMPFAGHLEELRARLIRVILYLSLGMTLCWIFYQPILVLIERPLLETLRQIGGTIQVLKVLEPFMMRAQTSLIGGLVLVLPFILLELWGFVKPGLTKRERAVMRTFPLVIFFLFLSGVAFGYWMAPVFFKWLLSQSFVLPGMKVQLQIQDAVLFMVKLLLAFGLGFQMPVVIVTLNRLGILPAEVLVGRWREATMVIFTMAAIITPTWDPLSMFITAVPLALLYIGTLGVIKLLDRRKPKPDAVIND